MQSQAVADDAVRDVFPIHESGPEDDSRLRRLGNPDWFRCPAVCSDPHQFASACENDYAVGSPGRRRCTIHITDLSNAIATQSTSHQFPTADESNLCGIRRPEWPLSGVGVGNRSRATIRETSHPKRRLSILRSAIHEMLSIRRQSKICRLVMRLKTVRD